MLAEHAGDGPVQIARIASAQAVPRKFLEAILLDLKRAGLVDASRGRSGGYWLTRDPADISFG